MILAFLAFWIIPPPDTATYRAQGTEVLCSFDAQGEIVMVPDGHGGTRPDCRARKDAA